MADSDDITHCPVCFEAYSETGNHIPRILPCHHTLCQKCMKELLHDSLLTCPEDRLSHSAYNGMFLQNKYIISYLQKEKSKSKEAPQEKQKHVELCRKHNRKQNIYCIEETCQKSICPLCLKSDHRNHNFEDLELVREREKLFATLKSTSENLRHKKARLVAARKFLNEQFKFCESDIEI